MPTRSPKSIQTPFGESSYLLFKCAFQIMSYGTNACRPYEMKMPTLYTIKTTCARLKLE